MIISILSFKDISNNLKKANKLLTINFKNYKNELINEYIKQINRIESAYEESYKNYMNILIFNQTLIDNFDESVEMKNSILNYFKKIEQCKHIYELLNYYNEYNIVESVKIEDVKNIKTITEHTDFVYSLFHLKDGRLASCSGDRTIRIYVPSKDYYCEQVIRRHSKSIRSICQLDDGIIVSGSDDKYQ